MKPQSIALCNALLEHHRLACPTGREPFRSCTIGYREICETAGVSQIHRHPGPFLFEIAQWCERNGWAPLNALAIDEKLGRPSEEYDLSPRCHLSNWCAEAASAVAERRYPKRYEDSEESQRTVRSPSHGLTEVRITVFISWAGKQSKAVARALRDWLPVVVPNAVPWMSANDIAPGGPLPHLIQREPDSADFYIICLTPDNLRSPWLYFEAGMIASKKDSLVYGFLTGVSLTGLYGPLSQFQCAEATIEGAWSLARAINECLGENKREDGELSTLFFASWPRLRENLREALLLYDPRLSPGEIETEPPESGYKLSDEAKRLLAEASTDRSGVIFVVRTLSGLLVQTNDRELFAKHEVQSQAKWQGAIRELVQQGLIEGRGNKGEVFNLTAEGYRTADELRAKQQ